MRKTIYWLLTLPVLLGCGDANELASMFTEPPVQFRPCVWYDKEADADAIQNATNEAEGQGLTISILDYDKSPAALKHAADSVLVSGADLLFLNHWGHQSEEDDSQPGVEFINYIARCQMMLRQGSLEGRTKNCIHRKSADADIYFVVNPGNKAMQSSFPAGDYPAELWDPITAKISLAQPGDSVRVVLDPGQSVFVVLPNEKTGYAEPFTEFVPMAQSLRFNNVWEVSLAPKKGDPFRFSYFELKDFSKYWDERIRFFSGTATYSCSFYMDRKDLQGNLELDLGTVHDMAQLYLNNRKVVTLWCPPYKVDVTDYLKSGVNTIQIEVTCDWANEYANLDLDDFEIDAPFKPGGLAGPVVIAQCGTEYLPDPLVKNDGHRVKYAGEWEEVRRKEILEMFASEMYGHIPPKPEGLHFQTIRESTVYNGLGIRKTVRIFLDAQGKHFFDVLIHLPAAAKGPVPVFAGLNFYGNGTTLYGEGAGRWPYEKILRAGMGVATAWRNGIEPDEANAVDGVRSWYYSGGDWGAISAWAWGLSRMMDYLQTDPAVDASRVAVIGHSRLGKAALWAGVNDSRFCAIIANDSGCCGAAISRRVKGETFASIDNNFPYWFTRTFDIYQNAEDHFPGDQHWLCALAAPRPLYISSAAEDNWADPVGEWFSAKAVAPVYDLYGLKGVGPVYPAPDHPDAGNTVAYHVRSGTHGITPYDWEQFIRWYKRNLEQ